MFRFLVLLELIIARVAYTLSYDQNEYRSFFGPTSKSAIVKREAHLRSNHLLTAAYSAEVLALASGFGLLNVSDTNVPRTEHLVTAMTFGKFWKNLATMEYAGQVLEKVAAEAATYFIESKEALRTYEYLFYVLDKELIAKNELKHLYPEVRAKLERSILPSVTYIRVINPNDAEDIGDRVSRVFQRHPELCRYLIDLRFLHHAVSFQYLKKPFWDYSRPLYYRAILIYVQRSPINADEIQSLYDAAAKATALKVGQEKQIEWPELVDITLYDTLKELLSKHRELHAAVEGVAQELEDAMVQIKIMTNQGVPMVVAS